MPKSVDERKIKNHWILELGPFSLSFFIMNLKEKVKLPTFPSLEQISAILVLSDSANFL
jgi:hypothetical protein